MGLASFSYCRRWKIRKNPKGLEAVVAKEITLNEMGGKHPMYVGKNKIFDAFVGIMMIQKIYLLTLKF